MALIPAVLTTPTAAQEITYDPDIYNSIIFSWETVVDAVQYAVCVSKFSGATLIDSFYLLLEVGYDSVECFMESWFNNGSYTWQVIAFDADGVAYTSDVGAFKVMATAPTEGVYTVTEEQSSTKPEHTVVIGVTSDWVEKFNTPLIHDSFDAGFDIAWESVGVDIGLDPLVTGSASLGYDIIGANPRAVTLTNPDMIDGYIYTVTPFCYYMKEDGVPTKATGTPIETTAFGDLDARTNV